MITEVSLAPSPLLAPAAATVAVVTCLVLYLVQRSARTTRRKAIVCGLNLLMAVALLAFLFPPLHTAAPTAVTLLTRGATDAQKERALQAAAPFAMADVALSDRERDRITAVHDLGSLARRHPGATQLQILGAGVDDDVWRGAPPWSVDLEPPPPVSGIRYARWPRRLETGEAIDVTGQVTASGESRLRVSLLEPSGEVAATDEPDDERTFELTGRTRAPGRYLFRLTLQNESGRVLESVPLPVQVVAPRAVSIVMLLSAPSFEARAVTAWARRGRARLAIRTAISRDRYRREFVNRASLPLGEMDAALLARFDLLIADHRAWFALAPREQAAIARRVDQHGLGVLLLGLEAADAATPALPLPPLAPAPARETFLRIDGLEPADTTLTLSGARFVAGARPLATDLSGTPVAAFREHGRGRTGVTLVTDSHRLVTAGHADLHAALWQALIAGLAPARTEPGVDIYPDLPVVGQRVQICVYGNTLAEGARLESEGTAPTPLALRPHALRPGERCGYAWPGVSGWHRINLDRTSRSFYVFSETDWRSRRDAQATAATRLQATGDNTGTRQTSGLPGPLPRWWFAIVLALLATALWAEQKWHDTARSRE